MAAGERFLTEVHTHTIDRESFAEFGNPGPEGPTFWAFLGLVAAIVWTAITTEPLWRGVFQ